MFKDTSLKYYKNKKVFITGHTGFKGLWLTNTLLSLGARIMGYSLNDEKIKNFKMNCDYKKVKSIYSNILDRKKLEKEIFRFKPQIIFHLAAQSLVIKSFAKPKETIETNLNGTLNILEICRKFSFIKSAVIITSDKCYLNKEIERGYREDDILGGQDPYSASKASAEIIFNAYNINFFKKKKIGVATCRAGNVIGGGDWSENRIIPDAIKSIKNKKKFYLRNPLSTRPWQHVLEPISGYLKLGYYLSIKPKSFSESWNFGPKRNQIKNVRNLIKVLSSNLYPFQLKVFYSKNKKVEEAKLLQLNSEKAFNLLKWKCKWNMEEAIEKTAVWYKNFLLRKDTKELIEKQIREYFNKS